MRRRALATLALAAAALGLLAASASAAAPSLGPLLATNIQGVSALLIGTVNPEGLATTYHYEYVDQTGFQAAGFAAAAATPPTTAGAGTAAVPARAVVSGLSPETTYHYRLVASNSSATTTSAPASFTTSHGFGFLAGAAGFSASIFGAGGEAATQAASHPYSLDLTVGLNQGTEFEAQPGVSFPDGDLRDLRIEMPPGLIANPNALAKCTLTQFHTPRTSPFEASRSGESCPDKSQLGTVDVHSSLGGSAPRRFGLFNLEPVPGTAAQLGFAPYGVPIVLDAALTLGPEATYTLSLRATNVPQSLDLSGLEISLWGVPWAASHNPERGNCLREAEPQFPWAKCSVGEPATDRPAALLTMPARCAPGLDFTISADAWQQGAPRARQAQSLDSLGHPAAVGGCASVPFEPVGAGQLNTTKASSGSGYNFLLSAIQEGLTEPTLRAPSPVRRLVVSLPKGVTVNPSVGAGLEACSPAGYAAESATSAPGAACPNGSKIGEFSVRSPLFDGLFEGAIYLATPDDPTTTTPGAENPFDSLVAVYLVAKHPQRGVLVKLAGKIATDPGSGDITAIFDNLPQLPYTELDLTFRAGQRAFLVSPPACGEAKTEIEATSWASAAAETTSTSSLITSGIDAGPCPPAGAPPFSPDAVTGGVNSNVGSYTPYFVHLTRKDTEQEITSYSLVLPKGITGKLAGIPFCPEVAIAAARERRGAAESTAPSCPAASRVGRTLTGYGVGAALTYAPGRIYLAGPYHGQPLSLVTINSATVGPFDLGTIVIRSAFSVDPHTAQLRIDSRASDPIPHIIDGIPLHLRDVRVYMDRYQFTHNPSSCEPSALVSTLTGAGARFDDPADDSSATISRHFQLLNCLTLGFRPKLGLRLRGGSRRGQYPSLRATFAARGPQDSNLKQIGVTMPHSLFLAQNHIRTVCTAEQFDAERCPPGSVYGHAVAYTPLFDEPLRGDVYLRSSTHKLPDLVASLRSGAVRIVIEGKIGPAKNGIRAFFDGVPDAPINRFVMTLDGGKGGLLVNSANICKAPPLATVSALGQNNLGARFSSTLRGQCAKRNDKGPKR
ncbi:MAG TPA: fibronectin type III domain-containing protein [Solirubrobacterales bacterium]|nr:fibronectin type III domain-containing protein [Solirubrobacterales bacterium]